MANLTGTAVFVISINFWETVVSVEQDGKTYWCSTLYTRIGAYDLDCYTEQLCHGGHLQAREFLLDRDRTQNKTTDREF